MKNLTEKLNRVLGRRPCPYAQSCFWSLEWWWKYDQSRLPITWQTHHNIYMGIKEQIYASK